MRILSHRVIISREVQAPAGDKRYRGTKRGKSEQRERGEKRVNANECGKVTTLIKTRLLPL